MKSSFIAGALAAAASACWVTGEAYAQVAGDPAKGKAIAAQICLNCHGLDGNGANPVNPDYPKLAGLQPGYIGKQLRDFQSGKRKSPVMTPFAATLNEEGIGNVAAHYAAQRVKPALARQSALLDLGKKVYLEGNESSGVPACAGCHGKDGSGSARFPRLAGQHAEYTRQQLLHFRKGERTNDRGDIMQSTAERMSEEEIRAVADYVVNMK